MPSYVVTVLGLVGGAPGYRAGYRDAHLTGFFHAHLTLRAALVVWSFEVFTDTSTSVIAPLRIHLVLVTRDASLRRSLRRALLL